MVYVFSFEQMREWFEACVAGDGFYVLPLLPAAFYWSMMSTTSYWCRERRSCGLLRADSIMWLRPVPGSAAVDEMYVPWSLYRKCIVPVNAAMLMYICSCSLTAGYYFCERIGLKKVSVGRVHQIYGELLREIKLPSSRMLGISPFECHRQLVQVGIKLFFLRFLVCDSISVSLGSCLG